MCSRDDDPSGYAPQGYYDPIETSAGIVDFDDPRPKGMTMAQDEKYNGWTNYETWNVNLWLSNDEGSYNDVRQMIADRRASDMDTDRRILGEMLREHVEESLDIGGVISGMAADLLTRALGRVDWESIVEAFEE